MRAHPRGNRASRETRSSHRARAACNRVRAIENGECWFPCSAARPAARTAVWVMHSRNSVSNEVAGTTRVTKRRTSASSADRMRLSSSISAATAGPTRRSKGTSSGSASGNPKRPIGTPKRAVSAASLMSHNEAISSPPPTHTPSIAAINGTGQRSIAASALPIVSR